MLFVDDVVPVLETIFRLRMACMMRGCRVSGMERAICVMVHVDVALVATVMRMLTMRWVGEKRRDISGRYGIHLDALMLQRWRSHCRRLTITVAGVEVVAYALLAVGRCCRHYICLRFRLTFPPAAPLLEIALHHRYVPGWYR